MSRASEPMTTLTLGDDEIVTVRAGGIVVAMGPTGAGKTSLIAGMLVAHARDHGPVVVLSRELPADELAARMIGMQCDASWLDVLTGQVPRDQMDHALALPRMYVLDRREATLAALVETIQVAKAEHAGAPVLVAVDYVQILESGERDARAKVADVMAQIDDIARAYRAVVIAISQMSRASSRAARNGESVGADSTDGGAESAAIERYATATLSIGQAGPDRDDGTRAIDLSIGKGRMTGGDRVIPMSYCGRSGRWRVAGESRPAGEVKAERASSRDATRVGVLVLAIPGALEMAAEPMSRRDVRGALGARDEHVRAAVEQLLGEPESGVVEVGPRRGGSYRLWIRTRAEAAGLSVIRRPDRSPL
ncbi:MAG: AAA family ATPase [Myxococcota bacterium]|nr:AAA family ATPase [Myxococcota bacterium]